MRVGMDNWMAAWTPSWWTGNCAVPGSIKVGACPDIYGWSKAYPFTTGTCWAKWKTFSLEEKVAQLFIDFHTAIVRDGIDPQAAHREFLKIDEYRRRISPDIKGAEND